MHLARQIYIVCFVLKLSLTCLCRTTNFVYFDLKKQVNISSYFFILQQQQQQLCRYIKLLDCSRSSRVLAKKDTTGKKKKRERTPSVSPSFSFLFLSAFSLSLSLSLFVHHRRVRNSSSSLSGVLLSSILKSCLQNSLVALLLGAEMAFARRNVRINAFRNSLDRFTRLCVISMLSRE